MKLSARIAGSAALLLVLANTIGCTKLRARDQLVKGVQAFKAGQYERAVNHFQESIKLDPNYDTAKLDLAAAYAFMVVPNLDTPENMKVAQKAIDGFNEVLAKNPDDLGALRQIASIHFNIKQYDQTKADEQKVISLDPKDAEAHDMIAVIDFTRAIKNEGLVFGPAGITDDGNGTPKKSKDVCSKLAELNAPLVDEALTHLKQAVDINPNYSDAMDYLNLTYRRKANIECGNDDARKADIAQADAWTQRAMGARKAIEAAKEKKIQGGIDMSK
jgi:tetratricopeptide (TPR) repeat protein